MSESWCTCRRSYPSGFDTKGCPVHDRPNRYEQGDPGDETDVTLIEEEKVPVYHHWNPDRQAYEVSIHPHGGPVQDVMREVIKHQHQCMCWTTENEWRPCPESLCEIASCEALSARLRALEEAVRVICQNPGNPHHGALEALRILEGAE